MRIIVLLTLFFTSSFAGNLCDSLYDSRNFKEARNCAESELSKAIELNDSIKALEVIAFSSYLLEDYAGASSAFDRILVLNRFHTLDSMNVPPEIIALFEGRRSSIRLIVPPPEQSSWRYAPLGIGQLAIGKKRGWVYAGLAALGLGLNVTMYWMRENDKNPDGSYQDANRAANYYSVQQGAFYGIFIGTAVISFIDAIYSNKGSVNGSTD